MGARWRLWLLCGAVLLLVACRDVDAGRALPGTTATPQPPPVAAEQATADDEALDVPRIVIAPGVRDSVSEALVREAFRRAVDQAERDFGLRPQRRITIYIDPDNAAGLEDAIGLSAKYAIHLRAGRTRSMDRLLPLMMHEYTHALQYQAGRLRPQWWVEGQADHQALRIEDAAVAERERRALYAGLAGDVRAGRAPSMSELRARIAWDAYIKKAGSGKAYGWGNAAVAFIEDRAGFEAVRRIFTDQTAPNTLSRFDAMVEEATGLTPAEFDRAVKDWVVARSRG